MGVIDLSQVDTGDRSEESSVAGVSDQERSTCTSNSIEFFDGAVRFVVVPDRCSESTSCLLLLTRVFLAETCVRKVVHLSLTQAWTSGDVDVVV